MKLKTRRVSVMVLALIGVVIWLVVNPASYEACGKWRDGEISDGSFSGD